jgi:hypothetical protein
MKADGMGGTAIWRAMGLHKRRVGRSAVTDRPPRPSDFKRGQTVRLRLDVETGRSNQVGRVVKVGAELVHVRLAHSDCVMPAELTRAAGRRQPRRS